MRLIGIRLWSTATAGCKHARQVPAAEQLRNHIYFFMNCSIQLLKHAHNDDSFKGRAWPESRFVQRTTLAVLLERGFKVFFY